MRGQLGTTAATHSNGASVLGGTVSYGALFDLNHNVALPGAAAYAQIYNWMVGAVM